MNATVIALDRYRDVWARILPFATYIVFMAFAPLLAQTSPEFDRRWLYAVQIAAVALVLAFYFRDYAELRSGPRLSVLQWIAAAATGCAVFVLWINLDVPWARLGEARSGFDPRDAGQIHWPLAFFRLLGAAVIVPVMEELFWRSFLMRWIDRSAFLNIPPARISLRALALSAVVFGLEHELWVAGIVAGLAYGWLYVRTGNLRAPILAHALTNLLLGLWVLATGEWHFW